MFINFDQMVGLSDVSPQTDRRDRRGRRGRRAGAAACLAALWALLGASLAAADVPTVYTGGVFSVSRTAATVLGSVDPHGLQVVDCEVQWGTTAAYDSGPVPCGQAPGSGEGPVPITANIPGLIAGTVYHYRFVASNSSGLTYGGDRTFVTSPPSLPPRAPVLLTGWQIQIRPHQAILHARVNPEGSRITECQVQWGRDRHYDNGPVRCVPSPGAGKSPVTVKGTLTGLAPWRTFHYRFVVRNAGGLVYGPDRTFTT
jgi:phosphodiesterase/alkaline phosphatase D-like protein